DNVILIGGDHEGHFPHLSSKDATNGKIIHIGTRDIKFSGNWNLVSFARPASSVSEIVAGLIRESGQVVDSEAATNLLIGIEEGSKHFTHPGVSAETFELVADLLRAGAKRIATPTPQRQFFPPGAIPGETPEPEKKEGKREGMEVTEAPKDWTRPPKVYTGTGGIPIS
ncbi:hypothetical protein HY008_02255, partial [Candidatus Woesebacteria bacterium]|nr:hypothetical protein [Candidatus Woesebacteria bacterium]